MKKITFFLFASMAMGGCDHGHNHSAAPRDPNAVEFYGEKFDTTGAITQVDAMAAYQGNDTVPVKFKASIVETCAKAGCWMTIANGKDLPMYVFMKDHEFGVPLNGCANLGCIVNGVMHRDTLSVKVLKHFAEDAQKSQAEIDAITEPMPCLSVTASGVALKGFEEHFAGDGHENCSHDHSH
jgi:Domain of unknown function (DUF4920)